MILPRITLPVLALHKPKPFIEHIPIPKCVCVYIYVCVKKFTLQKPTPSPSDTHFQICYSDRYIKNGNISIINDDGYNTNAVR